MKSVIVAFCLLVIICASFVIFTPPKAFALDVSARAIQADAVWAQGITGSGVRVAVLDQFVIGETL